MPIRNSKLEVISCGTCLEFRRDVLGGEIDFGSDTPYKCAIYNLLRGIRGGRNSDAWNPDPHSPIQSDWTTHLSRLHDSDTRSDSTETRVVPDLPVHENSLDISLSSSGSKLNVRIWTYSKVGVDVWSSEHTFSSKHRAGFPRWLLSSFPHSVGLVDKSPGLCLAFWNGGPRERPGCFAAVAYKQS